MDTTQQRSAHHFIRYLSEYPAGPGFGSLDSARRRPGQRFMRTEASSDNTRDRRVPIPPGELPAYGCAVGRCEDRLVRPIHPDYAPQRFAGFCRAWASHDEIQVQAQGAFLLRVHDVTLSRGLMRVFAFADTFTGDQSKGGVHIGFITRVESLDEGLFVVAFSDNLEALERSLVQRGLG